MERIYLDSCVVIYLQESPKPVRERIGKRVQANGEGVVLAVSGLAFLESIRKPLRNKDGKLLQAYQQFFRSSRVVYLEFTQSVFELAAQLYAQYELKTADSLHLAIALYSRCDVFLTNDRRLSKMKESISIEVI